MKKYWFIFKFEVLSTLQYVKNILIHMIGYILHIYIFFNLWTYIYEDSTKLINGYNKSQMIWYIIITEIIWTATSGREFCKRISNDVKTGNIAYNLNKPYSYVAYIISSHIGEMTVKALIATIYGIILGFIFLKEFPKISLIGVIFVLISMFLAVLINTLLITCIGLFSFIIEDASPFYWLYSKAILVLGTIFPVEYFPESLQNLIKVSPIYVTCYGPAKLFVDYSKTIAIKIITVQVIYLCFAWLICNKIFKKGTERINVNGG